VISVSVGVAPFDAAAILGQCARDGVGALASFIGIVRGDDGLAALTLEHYPAMTERALVALGEQAAARWPLAAVAIHHRVGRLVPGDPIVMIACASAHRSAALDACAFLIDRLKTDAPFWKREEFINGCSEWVEPRPGDALAAGRWV